MSARTDAEAAYFALLRAIDERDALLRERDYLHAERDRLDAFAEELRHGETALPRPPTRAVSATTKPLLEALGSRRAAVIEALERVDERIEAAEAFVAECQAEHQRLRSG